MSFLRRNKDEQPADSTPVIDPTMGMPPPYVPPSPEAEAKDKSPKGNIFQRAKQYLIDTYNGLYKIVLEPSMPTKGSVFKILFGIIIGMIWAYGIAQVEYTGANPHRLNQDSQDQWVKMAAVGFTAESAYGQQEVIELLQEVNNPGAVVERLLSGQLTDGDRLALENVQPVAQEIVGTPAPENPGLGNEIISALIPFIVVIIVAPILVLLWRLLIYPNIVAGILERIKVARNPEYAKQKKQEQADLKRIQEQRRFAEQMQADTAADAQYGEPVVQSLSIYTKGRPYDDSFAIELGPEQMNKFLGETGASIASKVGDDLQAVEFWAFDMGTQQTLTKIFLAEGALNDPTIRAQLAPRVQNPETDFAPATPGSKLILETDYIRVTAEIVGSEHNSAGGTPNSAIENLQMKLAAYQKEGDVVPASSAPPPIPPPAPLPDYSDIEFDPPPVPPSSTPQPSFDPNPQPLGGQPLQPLGGSSVQPLQPLGGSAFGSPPPASPPPSSPSNPLQPPPLQPPAGGNVQPLRPSAPPPEDDDPFGGTGDFTPLPGS